MIDGAAVRSHFAHTGARKLARRRGGLLGWLARRDGAALFRLLDARPGERALDVGAGAGLHARALAARGVAVTAVDLAPELVALVRPHVAEAVVGDLATLALGRRFPRVLCSGVLDYVADPIRCMVNLAEHVAEGGRLVVMVPRAGLAGRVYRALHRAATGIDVHLFDGRELDAAARASGLVPVGAARPLPHDLVLAWRR